MFFLVSSEGMLSPSEEMFMNKFLGTRLSRLHNRQVWGTHMLKLAVSLGGISMDVEPKIGGKPPIWMVKIMENPY